MKDQVLARKTIGEYRYEVFYDNYPMESLNDIDYESEENKRDYLDKFEKGDLSVFGVVKSKVCKCCCLWSEIDSLWGMHYQTAENCLEDYLKEYDEVIA